MIYVIGSLRSARPREVANLLREQGHEVFDDWHACGPEADEIWRNYEIERGRTYEEALQSSFAQHNFEFDRKHIQASDVGVLVLPAGKSGHLELGYMIGRGSRGYILFDGEPERWDLMYLFAHKLFFNTDEMLSYFAKGDAMPTRYGPARVDCQDESGFSAGAGADTPGLPHRVTFTGHQLVGVMQALQDVQKLIEAFIPPENRAACKSRLT